MFLWFCCEIPVFLSDAVIIITINTNAAAVVFELLLQYCIINIIHKVIFLLCTAVFPRSSRIPCKTTSCGGN